MFLSASVRHLLKLVDGTQSTVHRKEVDWFVGYGNVK